MSRWPIIAVVTSFAAIVGWLALARFIDEGVPESAIALYYARAVGEALPALIVPAILALFARPKWPAVLVGGMWVMFGFMLIGQHAGHVTAPSAAMPGSDTAAQPISTQPLQEASNSAPDDVTQKLQSHAEHWYFVYPFLNFQSTASNSEAIQAVVARRDQLVAGGMEAVAALDAAVNEVAPRYVRASQTDNAAWKKYFASVVSENMDGVNSNHPYLYFVPSGNDDASNERAQRLDDIKHVTGRGVMPGNMLAFAGIDSKTTANFILDAFKDAPPGSFNGVVVLFIGAVADREAVSRALVMSGAQFRFVEMSHHD